ncbi:MAG: type II toxin-antitoxin system RelE/ParE family toxin [Desulfurivibrionaceae bacterium]|jgi:addiction module RelE/StbE family toxin|nr:type II toxin-antitoxin system RelE/ParE family toxin [Pseudomonadota bacterium]MCG2823232.1 type II toxin-antitoxin system RelE/ParE family toxin [Desulfobulbaceae bacterium]MDP2002156.1 type II toxin-antitoxin system RelE/ParE family toxin [Desulfurivibrionaceae bacterium]PKN21228.1 MAG: plasmid stabilization protein [Deltaproteobacteria bacterium HGW-Deltaproteobacteria-3]MBU4408225.1 type II toxin-antitoxin system RelE/ParE family toxin [Pseudomonadota bacterium]
MKIIWSPLAIERVTEIARYIAQDNPTAAQKWVEGIFAKIEQVQAAPASGRIVSEVNRKEIREIILGNYRIVYRTGLENISILTVRHGRQILPVDEIVA